MTQIQDFKGREQKLLWAQKMFLWEKLNFSMCITIWNNYIYSSYKEKFIII